MVGSRFGRLTLFLAALLVWTTSASAQIAALDDLDAAGQCADAKIRAHASKSSRPDFRTSAASANFDATYYHLDLTLEFAPDYLYATTRIEGRVVGTPMATLSLDFLNTMQVNEVRSASGTPLLFLHQNDILQISFPAPLSVGAPVAVEVRYEGLPERNSLGTFAFGTRSNGDPYAWSLSEPYGARGWWPSKDHPSDKADSVRVTVTVPINMRVGSNGVLEQVTAVDPSPYPGPAHAYDWVSRYPISTYLVSVAAGVYDAFEQRYERPDSLAAQYGDLTLPILHYAYRGSNVFDGNGTFSGWKLVTEVLPVLEHWFGPYPFPEEKYGHAQFTFGGGMEHQTMSSMGGNSLGLIAHELGHMWYGDQITLETWPHLWLNEGFATMAELLYWQSDPERYASSYTSVFDLYYNRALGARGTVIVQDTANVFNLFDHSRVYSKGAMVLHMLRGWVGDDAFREILRAYSADEAVHLGTAVTDDFQRVAEAVSGVDLSTFFRQWVTQGTGYPIYNVRWSTQPGSAGGFDVKAILTQEHDDAISLVEVFEMPATFVIETASGAQSFTVYNDQRSQTFTFNIAEAPFGLRFDPDRLILRGEAQVVATEDTPDLQPHTQLTAVYPNPADHTLQVDLAVATPGPHRLSLFDNLGRQARLLLDRTLPPGTYHQAFDVSDLAPGTYVLRLAHGERVQNQAITIF